MDEKNLRISPQLILGICLLGCGILFTLDSLDILNARDYLRFWPLAVVAWGLATILDAQSTPGRVAGGVLCFIGSLLLLNNLNILHVRVTIMWPLILILAGAAMLHRAFGIGLGRLPRESSLSGFAILGGCNRTVHTTDFRGGDLTAVMGGCEIDLREAGMQVDEAVVNVTAFWGGIELKVPETWHVIMEGIPILGGFEDRTRSPREPNAKRLIVRGVAMMGGVEIRN